MGREYDIVLFGATGFTGELAARHLLGRMPASARWAIAGRDRDRLEAVRRRLTALDAGASQLPILIADAHGEAALAALARSTRVLASTVGPYLEHGEPLVAACVAAGTDYVDLCAETEFIDTVYLRYHLRARESGARIVQACGFDGLIADLGVLYTVAAIDHAERAPLSIRAFVTVSGAFSTGTLRSVVGALGRLKESGRAARQRHSVERNADDGRIAEGRQVNAGAGRRAHRERTAGGWVVPVQLIDTQQVLRSARLTASYGPEFSYSHSFVTGTLPRTVRLLVLFGVLATVAQLATGRRLLLLWRRDRSGPSAEKRARSSFRVRLHAHAGGNPARDVTTEVSGGDPGYGETSKMLAESALCLAFDRVPAPGGGQWTPALALGQPLIERLTAVGISFRVIEE